MKNRPWDDKWESRQELLGSGGQGTAYIVTGRDSAGEQAILKLLKNQKSPKARRRMHREVTNLKIVGAANGKVPHVLDGNTDRFDEEKIPLYFVMEYITGPTLKELVESDGPMPLDQALSVVRDLAFTIDVAHQEGVIHRDLKPQNIVARDPDKPDVFIVDYGLSFNEEQGDLTLTDEVIGSRFLTLPEGNVVGENRRDPRSELTLLCGILYYCLTATEPRQLQDSQGRSPHRRNGLMDKLDDPRAPRLELFFDRGFFPHIDNRFQTVQEFKTQLD